MTVTRSDRERRGGPAHRARMRVLGLRWAEVLVLDEIVPAPGGGFTVLRSHRAPCWLGVPRPLGARLAGWIGLARP